MKMNIVIVGGGPAGVIAALTAKSVYPDKSVLMIKDIGDGVVPCAIPYMIHTLKDPKENAMGNLPLENAGVKILVGKAVELDADKKKLGLDSGQNIEFERLILATGSLPIDPPIPGIDKQGIFGIKKSLSYNIVIREKAKKAKHIVIIGGGFIGAEFADEMARGSQSTVHIIEVMPKLLSTAFDDEFCDDAENALANLGVLIHKQRKVVSINGDAAVESVTLDNGDQIPADMVLIGIGGKPNVELAQQAGFLITDGGSIWVDSYMRTKNKNIFAIGDCALKRDFFTRQEVPVWLASTATAEARIAGTNVYGVRVLRQIQGTISAFSTKLGSLSMASAGMISQACKHEEFSVVSGQAEAPDRHPGFLPGAKMLKVKLIFAKKAGVLLGGQVSGGPSVGELINAIAIGIQMRLDVRELDMMQIATHPLLTSAPTAHPLINAAHQALAKLRENA
ncbi:MAG: FAD-dependent oxidoreductase [Desulfobacterales bacterium]|nr:FAD-dependent oxidoreductase [Desulfobacterales bacterium]